MKRKTITEYLPFLLPIRIKQREYFYFKQMSKDKCKYASIKGDFYSEQVITIKHNIINENSGYDIKYQYNKLDNLKLIQKQLNGLFILKGETFSFNLSTKDANKKDPYKDGLIIVNGKMIAQSGGGVCQMSNIIFEAILHSPLTIKERHAHKTDYFKKDESTILGLDATVNSGWLDLKISNETNNNYQLKVDIVNNELLVTLLSDTKHNLNYELRNENIKYKKVKDEVYKSYDLIRDTINNQTRERIDSELILCDQVRVKYKMEDEIYE